MWARFEGKGLSHSSKSYIVAGLYPACTTSHFAGYPSSKNILVISFYRNRLPCTFRERGAGTLV